MITLAGVIAIAISLVTFSFAAELPHTKLRVIGTWSHLNQYKKHEAPFWRDEIKNLSKGAITADIKGFNDLGLKGNEVMRLMRSGVIDFGTTVMGYLAADDPINEAIDLAGLSPDIETARKVSNAFKPVLEETYRKKYNVKLLGIWPYSAQVLFCNAPIKGLTDLKGKKVRTSNRTLSEFVDALGGTGVTLAFSEVVLALQNKVVDCAITGAMSGYSAKWYEVSTHLYELPVGWSQVVLAVSLRKWQRLDPKVQQFLVNHINQLENRIWHYTAKETLEGINCNTGNQCNSGKAANMRLVQSTADDKKQLKHILLNSVLPKWSKRCNKKCIKQWNASVGKVVKLTAN